MSYHGLIPLAKMHLINLINLVNSGRAPALLEVGVDRGVTFLTMANFLARLTPNFTAVGIDVLIQEQVLIMAANMDLLESQHVKLVQNNSLVILPELITVGAKFDVVFLDGDHNYHTVSQELPLIASLMAHDGVVIVDDYDGRWSEKDLWYAERPGYDETNATKRLDTEKHGVKPAVDDFVAANTVWEIIKPMSGEPVVLRMCKSES